MTGSDGLVAAFVLDGKGGGRPVGWEEIASWTPEDGVLWIHGDLQAADMPRWLEEDSGLPSLVRDALGEHETRPRSLAFEGGLLLNLRGVNLNPGADPEDMVSIRLWTDGRRIVSLRRRRLMAVDAIRKSLADGRGPATPGEFLFRLVDELGDRIANIVGELEDHTDDIEEQVLESQSYETRIALSGLRRQAIALRRYLAPQREAMARLHAEAVPWLTDRERLHLREAADRTTRLVEDLDTVRERAAVTREELDSHLAERMNRTMYVLSIVAAIFLPLGFLTGLLGINVGGIPGADTPWAFAAVCGFTVAVALGQLLLFRRLHWL